MYPDINNKVVLITGSTRGIGRATALVFLKNGAKVVINSRHKIDVQKIVKEFQKEGYSNCFGITADVSEKEGVDNMIKKIIKDFGIIDILVNNAGICIGGRIEEVSERDWNEILGINLWGTFLCCQKVAPVFKKNSKGKIINIASDIGKSGDNFQDILPPLSIPYSVSKGGVITLTKSLAKELAPFKVNVNAVCPGIIKTSLIPQQLLKSKRLKRKIPLGKLGEPEDVANLILFLASDQSEYITGQAFSVNGGMYMNF